MKEKKVDAARAEKAKEEEQKHSEEVKAKKELKPEEKSSNEQQAAKKPVKKTTKKVTKKKLPEEIHTINLRAAYDKPRTRRVKAAVNLIRDYVLKHKRKPAKISEELNSILLERGIEKPPRRIRVKLVIGPEEVTVYPAK